MNLLAIDPGSAGGFAWRSPNGTTLIEKMPDTQPDICRSIKRIHENTAGIDACYIEDLPRFIPTGGKDEMPSSRMGTMFENFGIAKGCLMTLEIRMIMVTPQKWQKALSLGSKGLQRAAPGASKEERVAVRQFNERAKREWKRKLKEEAQRRFPSLDVTLNVCDALLILEFARMCENQQEASRIITPQPQPSLL